jgi:DNA-binding MarR family transcriptional regulator
LLPPDDPIAQDILRRIRQLVRGISIHSKLLQRTHGLTVPQVVCLRAIEKLEKRGMGSTVAEVSEAVQLSPTTVSRIIERMTSSGLVARERNVDDRRKVCISLTKVGRERLADMPPPLQETFLQRLDELSLEQRMELLSSLRTLVDLMNAGTLDAAPLLVPGGEEV